MGVSPDNKVLPNGVDFWWDSYPTNTGNCWSGNTGAPGKLVTSSPLSLPDCANGTNPSLSIGLGDVLGEAELLACFGNITAGSTDTASPLCPWFTTPPIPASPSAAGAARAEAVSNP